MKKVTVKRHGLVKYRFNFDSYDQFAEYTILFGRNHAGENGWEIDLDDQDMKPEDKEFLEGYLKNDVWHLDTESSLHLEL